MPGWRSLADMWDFHNYEQPFSPDVLRFESGTPTCWGRFRSLRDRSFERSGLQAISDHVLALTDRLCEGLAALDAEFSTLRGRNCSSGIVTFSIPGLDSVALGRALKAKAS